METSQRPIIGVGAVIFHEDCVLLVKRGKPPKKYHWSIPGGRQNWGETVQKALLREIHEETGLKLKELQFLAVVDFIEPDQSTDQVSTHFTLIDFWAECPETEIRAGGDVLECNWVGLERLRDYNLWSETDRIIRLAAEQRQR